MAATPRMDPLENCQVGRNFYVSLSQPLFFRVRSRLIGIDVRKIERRKEARLNRQETFCLFLVHVYEDVGSTCMPCMPVVQTKQKLVCEQNEEAKTKNGIGGSVGERDGRMELF